MKSEILDWIQVPTSFTFLGPTTVAEGKGWAPILSFYEYRQAVRF